MKYQPAKKIIFVFLVLTLVSSLSAVGFVTGNNNVNLAFAATPSETCPDHGNCLLTTKCPDGSTPDAEGQCPQKIPFCPDGSAPDANGNCPSPKETTRTTPSETCPDHGNCLNCDANGNCPSSPDTGQPPSTPQKIPFCPDGSPVDANGNCRIPANP